MTKSQNLTKAPKNSAKIHCKTISREYVEIMPTMSRDYVENIYITQK